MKKNAPSQILMTIFLMFFCLSCGAAVGDGASTDADVKKSNSSGSSVIINKPVVIASALKCRKGTPLTYKNFGHSFILTHCSQCHSAVVVNENRVGAPEEINFDTAELVQIWRANILDSLDDRANPMPPEQSIEESKLDQFEEWLDCGAPTGLDQI
jgi:uncharacterized membrane protein